jgi:hypothetical protein
MRSPELPEVPSVASRGPPARALAHAARSGMLATR